MNEFDKNKKLKPDLTQAQTADKSLNKGNQLFQTLKQEFTKELDLPEFWKVVHSQEILQRNLSRIKKPAIRDRVFTSELRELAQDIKNHQPENKIHDVVVASQTNYSFVQMVPKLDRTSTFIANLHLAKDLELPDSLLYDYNRRFNALASAILLYSTEDGAFRTVLSSGFDTTQKLNFWISARDPFFQIDQVQSFVVEHSLKENPFFKKRFTSNFLESLGGIVSIPRADWALPAILIFFFDDDPPDLPIDQLQNLLNYLHPLLVRDLEKEKRTVLRRNVYQAAAREVKAFLNLVDSGRLLQCRFSGIIDADINDRFLDEIKNALLYQRQVLVLRFHPLSIKILIGPDIRQGAIIELIQEFAARFGITVSKFEMPINSQSISSAVL